jgi:hypothetical protein
VWSNEQLEQWRFTYQTYVNDSFSVKEDAEVDQRRMFARQEMIQVLKTFLDGDIPLKTFNTLFQQKTHRNWSAFHLQGMSGGLFLNKLVKHVPSEDSFGHLFRLVLRVPKDEEDGRRQMQAFLQFLEGLITSRQVTRAQLQPARAPFFLSACWHVQDPERWPIYYLDVRQAVLSEVAPGPSWQDPVAVYFAFRARFLALAEALGHSAWQLEHLASWRTRGHTQASTDGKERTSSTSKSEGQHTPPQKQVCVLTRGEEGENGNGSCASLGENSALADAHLVSCRTHLQWLLAKLGHKVGCRVWIAAGDHSKECQHERLGNLSLPTLPHLADTSVQQIIRQIDVLWLLDNEVVVAYEIEQAHTDVSRSLLRLYDLGALLPSREVHLCIVAPSDRFEKIRFELSRPTFRDQAPRKRCALISEARFK